VPAALAGGIRSHVHYPYDASDGDPWRGGVRNG
jgi:hypothetical protein